MRDALVLSAVTKSFGQLSIIKSVNLSVREGERHALIGPNGAGKSTLFNLISGRLPADSGTILLFGQPIQTFAPHLIARRGLSRSFQITNLFPRLTVLETLESALLWPSGIRYCLTRRMRGLSGLRRKALDLATELGLGAAGDIVAGELPYADQRALEIGVAVAGDARVILLDEPTAGMSRSETERTVALIRKMTTGRTLVMVEHDMDVVFNLADRISVLAYGNVIVSGSPAEVRANAAVQEAYLGTAMETVHVER